MPSSATSTTYIYTLSLHDALPISPVSSWFLSSLDQHRPNFHISFFAQVQNNTKLLENLAFRSLHAPIRVQSFPPMHGKPVNVFRVTILAHLFSMKSSE